MTEPYQPPEGVVVRDPNTGKALVHEGEDSHVWVNPDTGTRFTVSPMSGAVIKVGGKFGGKGGRPPKVFKEFAGEALNDPGTYAKLLELAHSPNPAVAQRAIDTLAKYTQELPKQTSEHTERIQILVGESPLGFEEIPDGECEEIPDVIEEAETERPQLLEAPRDRGEPVREDHEETEGPDPSRPDVGPAPGAALLPD
jgi:hypothetical protein